MDGFDEEFDFVMVGSGAGAMTAALLAHEEGMSSLIVEKQDKVGGSTAWSGGVWWIPNNPVMKRAGVQDSDERARTYFDAAVPYSGPGSSPQRREAFLHGGPEMVRFLEKRGMPFEHCEGYADYYDELPGGEARGRSLVPKVFDIKELGPWRDKLALFPGLPLRVSAHELGPLLLVKRTWAARRGALRIGARIAWGALRGKDVRGSGGAMQGRMLQLVLKAGIQVRPGTKVTGLITDKSGRVTGITVERQGVSTRIGARKGVLINAGGFSHNSGMREKFGPTPEASAWTMANPGDTGEVLEAAMGLGAAVDCMDEAWWMLTSLGPGEVFPEKATTPDGTTIPFGHHFDISLPHCILVDQDGNRFTDESGSYMENGQRLYARHAETGRGIPAWAILDSRHRRRYLWGFVLGSSPKSWLTSGYLKKADTLESLAAQCGIDVAGLRRTVDRFNGFCVTGVDEDFNRGARAFDRHHGDPTVKPNPNLGTIERAPFYGVAIYPSDVGTAGGLVTDVHGRVLREDGDVIEGLYATGNSTASVMGRTYPGAGASIAASAVFGYLAAKHAAGV